MRSQIRPPKTLLYPWKKTLMKATCLIFSTRFGSAFSSSSRPGASITTKPEFTSCSSPRFDVFSEKLVGDWKWQDTQDSVCEVMRSCGGAVQGIRELPSFSSQAASSIHDNNCNDQEGYYLNRANDGFLYFDKDGSYSCGPVSGKDKDSMWISSLMVGKSRIILAKNVDDENDDAGTRLQVFHRSVTIDPSAEEPEIDHPVVLQELPDNIAWQEVIRCRMASSSQPWMAQRLKWEIFRTNDDEQRDAMDQGNESRPSLQSWILRMPTDTKGLALDGIFEDMSEGYVLTAGCVCSTNGIVKSIARQYSGSDGVLKSVAWLQGTTAQQKQ